METRRNLADKQVGTRMRRSNIELLKIIAVFLIVLSHCIPYEVLINCPIFFDITQCSEDVSHLFLVFFRYLGQIGNAIFVVCSC